MQMVRSVASHILVDILRNCIQKVPAMSIQKIVESCCDLKVRCNHLLKKAICTKQMKPFWILFIVLCVPTSTLVASYFVLFQYLEQTGIFPASNIFIEGEESLLFNSILLLPGTLVINLAFCGLLLFGKPAIRKRTKAISLRYGGSGFRAIMRL